MENFVFTRSTIVTLFSIAAIVLYSHSAVFLRNLQDKIVLRIYNIGST